MDRKQQEFTKERLHTIFLECREVQFTARELADILTEINSPLLKKAIDIMLFRKTYFLRKVLDGITRLLQTAAIILEKDGYPVETEKDAIEYVTKLLKAEKRSQE